LRPERLPLGVVAIDGKSTAIEAWDNKYAQRHRDAYGKSAVGLPHCCISIRHPVYEKACQGQTSPIPVGSMCF
jgi:hypothetical protein